MLAEHREPDPGPRLPALPTPLALLILFLAGLLCCLRYDPSSIPLSYDNQHYFFIAERAASGVAPHVSQFDPKHALSMLATAGAMRLGRRLGVDDVIAARVLSIVATASCAALVWLLAREVSSLRAAPWLVACTMLTFTRFFYMGAMGARPKVFLVVFTLLAMLLVARRRSLAAGSAAAGAFLCWQPALLVAAAGVVGLAVERRARAVAAFGFAFIGVNLAYEAYFIAHGALAEQIEQAYLFPATFMQAPFPPPLDIALRRLGWLLRVGEDRPAAAVMPTLALLGLFAFWARVLWRARRHGAPIAIRADGRGGLVCVVLAGHGALLFTLTSYQGYPDGFFLAPFMALLCGTGIAALAAAVARRLGSVAAGTTVLVAGGALAAIAALTPAGPVEEDRRHTPTLADQRALASEVGRFLDAGMSVYAVGCTHLLAFNHADNFVPYGFFFRGLDRYLLFRLGMLPYMPYRRGELPDVLLASRSRIDRPTSWVPRHYREQPDARFNALGIRVWFRQDAQAAGQSM